MIKLFNPRLCARKIQQLTRPFFADNGIDGIILDVDDTVLSSSSKVIPEEIKKWIQDINRDIPIYILSNNFKKRVKPIADQLGLPYISFACKPFTFKIKRALRQIGFKRDRVCIIGDQIFTDVIAGNSAGIFTIYVDPLSSAESPLLKLKRRIEYRIKRNYKYYEYEYRKKY